MVGDASMNTVMMIFAICMLEVSNIQGIRQRDIQSYQVTGTLICGDKPARGVRVKLVDDDFGFDPDDDLNSALTDANGKFDLSGHTAEFTMIDPHLKIYHDCNDGITPCQRRWKFELPHHYITKGNIKPDRNFNIGTWNLEAILPGESHDCIHK